MPAIYNAFLKDGLSPHNAWRVSFVVPGILIVSVATALLLLCPDTPRGKWSHRLQSAQDNLRVHGIRERIVDVPGQIGDEHKDSESESKGAHSEAERNINEEKKHDETHDAPVNHEIRLGEQEMLDTARAEVIAEPSFKEIMKTCFSPQTLTVGACYFCTFGSELAINSTLGLYFSTKFPSLGLSGSGSWAAMFGLMNIVFRPLGGIVSDYAYAHTKSVWTKKILLHSYSFLTGAFLIAQGVTNSPSLAQMVGLINVGAAFFLEGANGLNYSLVPHVHPSSNGIVSGFVGASGNFGGIIFAVIFLNFDHSKSFWIIGTMVIVLNLLVCWIRPIPKGQVGGR